MRPIILISIALILSVGCTQKNSESQQDEQSIDIEQTSFEDKETLTNQQIASHLATVASDVPNVNDAAAIIAGPYAVVAIDIDAKTKRERVGTIKYSVSESLQHDPYGRTAVVIADADIMTRVREMGNQLQKGKPVKGVIDELAGIVSRYMPMFPVDEKQLEPENKQTNPNSEMMEKENDTTK